MPILSALLAGFVFGMGLLLSGMADPSKVLGFLDVTGRWDPSLVFVMAGAVAVGLLAFGIAQKRTSSLLGGPMRLPAKGRVDGRLVTGGLIFGVGWGVAGFCPGPAIVALAIGGSKAVLFVAAMLIGMALFELFDRVWRR